MAANSDRKRIHNIAVIAGDGIGKEVVPAAVGVLDAAAEAYGFGLKWTYFPWGSDYFRAHGKMMPDGAVGILSEFDAIFLGAVGEPGIPDHVTLWGLLIPIRRGLKQRVNLRPVETLTGVPTPLRADQGIDLVIVRENIEGEYSNIGGTAYPDDEGALAVQETIFTRRGIEEIATYAFGLAARRRGKLTSATKSNGIIHTMPFWDGVVDAVASRYPGVHLSARLIDALAADLVLHPERFDVIVASNLFGDILSDLTAAVTGSIGIAPSANLNIDGRFPSMFEPIHGSAPDIAGLGVANPVGQVWSGALMLRHLDEETAADAVISAFKGTLAAGIRTPDIGGTNGTEDVAHDIAARLRSAVAK